MFRLHNFSYYNIKPFQLEMQPGDVISLFGPSGSGKTLLLRALADLDRHEGEMLLEERSYLEFEPQEWRRLVGLLPAESSWWFQTVGEHFPICNQENLSSLGFTPATLNWDIHRLSVGEKQRLGLLRLLANRPRVLLLDEPTANLDQDNRERVEQLLAGWLNEQNGNIIWVTHDRAQRQRVADRHFDIVDDQLREVNL